MTFGTAFSLACEFWASLPDETKLLALAGLMALCFGIAVYQFARTFSDH